MAIKYSLGNNAWNLGSIPSYSGAGKWETNIWMSSTHGNTLGSLVATKNVLKEPVLRAHILNI